MKRFVPASVLAVAFTLALSGPAYAFHHIPLPSTDCAAAAAGSPSDDNGQAKEALLGRAGLTLPLAPVGTAGQPHLASAPAHDTCANAQ